MLILTKMYCVPVITSEPVRIKSDYRIIVIEYRIVKLKVKIERDVTSRRFFSTQGHSAHSIADWNFPENAMNVDSPGILLYRLIQNGCVHCSYVARSQ